FIVGDPDQTIYSWRGSHVGLFNDFTAIHHQARSISLTANYRSSPEIIAASGTLIDHNPGRVPYRQEGVRPPGPRPVYFRAKSAAEEAKWVRDRILELWGAGQDLGEVAVIYRAHHLSRPIEEALVKGAVPYRLFSGTAFYDRQEIRDMISYLRMLTVADDLAFLRTVNVPSRHVGRKRLAWLSEVAGENGWTLFQALSRCHDHDRFQGTRASSYVRAIELAKAQVGRLPLGELFQRLLDLTGYEAYLRLLGDQDRLDNAAELKRALLEYGQDDEATIDDFLAQAALFANIDRDSPERTVKLMSIHAAKGLEFEAVFLVGLSEGNLPSNRALTPEELAEERRLCYVAMTRARDRLFLSNSTDQDREGHYSHTSRFVYEMGQDNLVLVVPPGRPPREYRPMALAASPRRLAVGQMIAHPSWGPGRIVSLDEQGGTYQVQFERLRTPRALRFDAPLITLG
ncbi:MAG: ATP-binding domain-containing protein, partial [Deltaproteobacteria bacterium]|nr:ATP-binding domain-containing protein [Deltaproteobacteria bacterium]